MNKLIRIIKLSFFGLMLIFPTSSFSSPESSFSSPESSETVTKRGTVNDDYYSAGGVVDINAKIAGDVVVSGGELIIRGRIQGDVIAAGGSVDIGGELLDDVRAAGGEISIDANITDDLIAAGGAIRVSSDTSTGGNAWLAGGDVSMAGTINKGLLIKAGTIRISGTIRGDVDLEGGDIQILEGTVIEGSLHYKSPKEAKIHSAAKITGDVTFEQIEREYSYGSAGIVFSMTLLVAGIVLFLLFPSFTSSATGRISTAPWKSLGLGLIVLIVTPIAAVLLMSIVLGVWVGLSILAFYFVALITGLLIGCFFVGDWGARLFKKELETTAHKLISLILAIVVIGLLQLIPVIGCLLVFALLLLGLGASISQLHFVYSQSKTS